MTIDLFEAPDHVGAPSVTGERDEHGIRWSRHKPPRPYIFDPEKGKEVLYARCTSWIDCLDDRSVLERWKQRIVLVGLSLDPRLIERVLATNPNDKDELEQITEAAFEAGDGYIRSQKGTDLHKLCEIVDLYPWDSNAEGLTVKSLLLQYWAAEDDIADVLAYDRTMLRHGFEVIDTERRVVVDELRVTGTFDRTLRTTKDITGPLGDVALPAGWQGIADIKTGRVDWGMSKMAMQLAVYARGSFYDGHTQQRSPMESIDHHVGLIIHLPQGEARCTVYTVDLQAGWEGVQLARQVREWRAREVLFEPLPS